jgi:hypothetical protein
MNRFSSFSKKTNKIEFNKTYLLAKTRKKDYMREFLVKIMLYILLHCSLKAFNKEKKYE